jgi:segregation and condensation protein B
MEVDYGRLSRAALETLAIIAYRQPITRGGIEAVRGVNSDYSVHTLIARGLIEEVGRAPGPGRPILLASTHRFLEYFGLQQPADLPPLPEIEGVDLDAHAHTQPLPEPDGGESEEAEEIEEELVETASG